MIYPIVISRRAVEDILALRDWIAGQADVAVASAYVDRIENRINTLPQFPDLGTIWRRVFAVSVSNGGLSSCIGGSEPACV